MTEFTEDLWSLTACRRIASWYQTFNRHDHISEKIHDSLLRRVSKCIVRNSGGMYNCLSNVLVLHQSPPLSDSSPPLTVACPTSQNFSIISSGSIVAFNDGSFRNLSPKAKISSSIVSSTMMR